MLREGNVADEVLVGKKLCPEGEKLMVCEGAGRLCIVFADLCGMGRDVLGMVGGRRGGVVGVFWVVSVVVLVLKL